jgi:hypothetical protein
MMVAPFLFSIYCSIFLKTHYRSLFGRSIYRAAFAIDPLLECTVGAIESKIQFLTSLDSFVLGLVSVDGHVGSSVILKINVIVNSRAKPGARKAYYLA